MSDEQGSWGPMQIGDPITFKKYQENGCPKCGKTDVYPAIQTRDEAVVSCAECGYGYVILFEEAI